MLSNQRRSSATGKITGITHNRIIRSIIEFIEGLLIKFKQLVKKKNLIAEEDLTQELVTLLNWEAMQTSFKFYFDKEHKTIGGKRRVDIGVIQVQKRFKSNSIFSIEAKRLPTDKTGKPREKEYIAGNYGGIERFKRSLHGAGLDYCAIIAYVQENTFAYWFNQINSWIDELVQNTSTTDITWNGNEKLNNLKIDKYTSKCESTNQRTIGNNVTLFHLWVGLS